MSIKLMDKAWESGYATGAKFVLVALCDNSNDQGMCWPSIATIAKKCGMSERSVYIHLDTLGVNGAVERIERPGKQTIYKIDPCRFCTPADSAPLQILHKPLQILQTPNKGNRQEPSVIDFPQEKNPKNPKTPKKTVSQAPEGVEQSVWEDFLVMRKEHKAPVTQTALDGLVREGKKAALCLNEVLVICCERSWRGFSASWLQEGRPNGFAAPVAVTTPSRPGIDPTIAKLDAEAKLAAPPPAAVRAYMAQVTGRAA